MFVPGGEMLVQSVSQMYKPCSEVLFPQWLCNEADGEVVFPKTRL
jgi:hypothetical protein